VEVIGTALSGEAALELLEKKQPDVLLQDLGLPRMSGIEVTREVKRRWPEVEVLIFTIFDEEEKSSKAVKAGASGYLAQGRQLGEDRRGHPRGAGRRQRHPAQPRPPVVASLPCTGDWVEAATGVPRRAADAAR